MPVLEQKRESPLLFFAADSFIRSMALAFHAKMLRRVLTHFVF